MNVQRRGRVLYSLRYRLVLVFSGPCRGDVSISREL